VPSIPTVKHIADTNEDLCIFFSTSFPANAADIPKKKIAKEKAQPTANADICIRSAIMSLIVDQQ
jgi:hypothetical protein